MDGYVIVEEYLDVATDSYMRMYPDSDPVLVREVMADELEKSLIDIPCTLHNDTYHEYVDTTILDVFNWLRLRHPIISGNGSFFKQHSEYTAPSIKVLETWLMKRKKLKKLMFKFNPGSIEYNNYNTAQGNQKVICNAEYGESGTPLSSSFSVYIPPATTGSAKNLTTSLICILELFVGNTDTFILLKDINEMVDFMFNVLHADDPRPNRITATFTPEEVSQRLYSMIRKKNESDYQYLLSVCRTLSSDDLSKLMLAYNPRLMMNHFLCGEMTTIGTYLKQHLVDLENCTPEALKMAGFGEEAPDEIADLINLVFGRISDSTIYPYIPNDVEYRAEVARRDLICVVDTDSLMLHYPKLINEFKTDTGNFRMSCVCAAGFGTRLFAKVVVPRFINYFALNCGIEDEYYRKKLEFKNEFSYLMMILMQKKMYLASIFVQEGNPRNIHKIDAKGVQFKKRDSADFLEPLILGMCDRYMISVDQISIDTILNTYMDIRDDYRKRIYTDVEYYTKQSVKAIEAYAKSKTLPIQMRGSQIWNEIMSTEPIVSLDRVYIIWLSFDKLAKADDPRGRRLYELCKRYSPSEACICLPETYKQIPEWVSKYIDGDYNIDKLLGPFKQILGVFNVYLPENKGSFKCTKMLFT